MKYLFVFLMYSSLFTLKDSTWTFEKKVDDITAYSRIKNGTYYYEFRTPFYVNSTLTKVTQVLMDINDFKNWLPNTKNSKLLKRINTNSSYGYTVTSTPWPLSERDLVFKMTKKKIDENNYHIILVGEEDYHPKQNGKVRVKDYNAIWKIKKTKSGVHVDYIASFDPDSNTPTWMIKNSMITARIEVSKALQNKLK